ncbi:MAG: alkaline phosphatase family protein, partial [Flavobacteriaceae bacterium]|nr:alkaline phosphatase family protein [Flavobacteriaceae bacterium]
MNRTAVINVVGLSNRLIGEHTPFIKSMMEAGSWTKIKPVLPAVTCSTQSTYLTGKWPKDHGIIGNGWYFKEEHEVKFWRQSNSLVQADKIWDICKREDPHFTCANLFWWYNMYSSVDYSITPRPNYLADGRKIPDIYTHPPELRDSLQTELGQFPLFSFWGPRTNIKSSQWIANAAYRTDEIYKPTLSLVYIPHLDYGLQKYGLDFSRIGKDLREVDALVKELVTFYRENEVQVMLLSEYGITDVNRPVHLNRVFREKGLLSIRIEQGLELLDAGASEAFAVADHQIAHIYVKDRSRLQEIKSVLQAIPGVEKVIEKEDQGHHLQHERSGDLIAVADASSWFTYYYWKDDKKAPDFARCVDIHRKPGYDPVELFTKPGDPFVSLKVIWKLIRKKLGFRTLMNVIPLQTELVKGSHGRIPEDSEDHPVVIVDTPSGVPEKPISAVEIHDL